MLNREPQEQGILDYCADNGIGFISFSPLAQGLLTDRYLNGIPTDSRMSKGKFLKKDMLTPELLDQLEGMERGSTAEGPDAGRAGTPLDSGTARRDLRAGGSQLERAVG